VSSMARKLIMMSGNNRDIGGVRWLAAVDSIALVVTAVRLADVSALRADCCRSLMARAFALQDFTPPGVMKLVIPDRPGWLSDSASSRHRSAPVHSSCSL
jgi:hypothetical protein